MPPCNGAGSMILGREYQGVSMSAGERIWGRKFKLAIQLEPGSRGTRSRDQAGRRSELEWPRRPAGSASRLGLPPQLDDVRNRAFLDAQGASRASICLDHVCLPVAVDPCPEPVSKR
jgi:hypothetical protein